MFFTSPLPPLPHFHLIPALPSPVLQTVTTSLTLYSPRVPPLLSPKPRCPLVPFQILLFSLALIILPSFSPFQGQPEARPEGYQLHGGKRQGHNSPKDEPGNSILQNSPREVEFWASLLPTQMIYHYTFSSVISRNILTHEDMIESLERPVLKSKLEELPEVPTANGSTKTHLKMRVKARPTGQIRGMVHADEM